MRCNATWSLLVPRVACRLRWRRGADDAASEDSNACESVDAMSMPGVCVGCCCCCCWWVLFICADEVDVDGLPNAMALAAPPPPSEDAAELGDADELDDDDDVISCGG